MSGFGRFEWLDGSYYIGQFKNGYMEGTGKLVQPWAGKEKEGYFFMGSYVPPNQISEQQRQYNL